MQNFCTLYFFCFFVSFSGNYKFKNFFVCIICNLAHLVKLFLPYADTPNLVSILSNFDFLDEIMNYIPFNFNLFFSRFNLRSIKNWPSTQLLLILHVILTTIYNILYLFSTQKFFLIIGLMHTIRQRRSTVQILEYKKIYI